MMPDSLAALIRSRDPAVISLDVFDTLLLRGLRPELSRFGAVARAQSSRLRGLGVDVPAEALYRERLAAGRRAYERARAHSGLWEPRYDEIMDEVRTALSLPASTAPVLRSVELDYELGVLRLNDALVAALRTVQADGRRLVLTSDMYLSSDDILDLLHRKGCPLTADATYVSSDRQRTKRAGTLFDLLVAEEGLRPEAILHVGDHPQADVAVPAARGLAVAHLPRGALWRGAHWAARTVVRKHLRWRGLVP